MRNHTIKILTAHITFAHPCFPLSDMTAWCAIQAMLCVLSNQMAVKNPAQFCATSVWGIAFSFHELYFLGSSSDSSGSCTLSSMEYFAWPPWKPVAEHHLLGGALPSRVYAGLNLVHWYCGAVALNISKSVRLRQWPPCEVAKLCTEMHIPGTPVAPWFISCSQLPARPALEKGWKLQQGACWDMVQLLCSRLPFSISMAKNTMLFCRYQSHQHFK